MKYIATLIFSTQVGEDSWRVVCANKEITTETTVQEILDWTKKKSVTTQVRLEINEVE